MNIHEYQAKQLFEEYGVPVPRGYPATNEAEIKKALDQFPEGKIVVKSQIHAGGRGKGTFKDGYKGGVKVCSSKAEAKEAATKMLGNVLVTLQTGEEGKQVNTVYLTEASDIEKEYYLAILLDRAQSKPVIIASTEGGVDIEKVADETPDRITHIHVDPALGVQPYQVRLLSFKLGFQGEQAKQMSRILTRLYKLFWEKDCTLVEINPMTTNKAGKIEALDAKVSFDENALFRHPAISAMRDKSEEDPKEVEASEFNLNYIALDGNIACMVNGAGLAMATMDIIKYFGGNPANFLDVGGGATEEQVTAALRIIVSDNNVKGILINIFGGIMKCDVIAKGVIAAARNVEINMPMVVRLEGTNVEEGKRLLNESGLALIPADSLSDAAQKIVSEVQKLGY